MAGLARRDFEQVEEFLREMYRLRGVGRLIEHVLTRLPTLVAATQTTWNHVVPSLRQAQVTSWPAQARHDVYEAALARHVRDHPLVRRFAETGDPRAFKISDVVSRTDFHDSALYDELYRPLGYEDQFALNLGPPGSQMVTVVVARDRRNFTERDRAVLNLLRPHLAQAHRHLRAMSRLARRLEAGRGELAASRVVLDRRDLTLAYPARARRWIEAFFDDLPRSPGRLPPTVERWLALARAVRMATTLDRTAPPLVVQRGGRQLIVRLAGHEDAGRTTLMMEEWTSSRACDSLQARGLTRREIEVLLEVEKGQHNVAIAAVLGLRPRTVQKHLEHIFDKLGVDNRTAAVAVLRRVVPAP
jgi:DNA-binding CsgD family transcriptional regulator